MQFVQPLEFEESIRRLGSRSPIGSMLSSSEWSDVPVALRLRAFFSARVESVRFLQRAKDSLVDFLRGARAPVEPGVTALKTGSRADFVKRMQDFLSGEGIVRTTGDVRDITSERRLGLIFDVQTRQAQDFGYWKQGMDPDVLDEFPAQRFIRVQPVNEPRNEHMAFEGEVRLKSDVGFWTALNQDFGVPWGPWGWGCGHDVEDVDRDEAEALGLIVPGQRVEDPQANFNDRLSASLKGLHDDMADLIIRAFGDRARLEGQNITLTKE